MFEQADGTGRRYGTRQTTERVALREIVLYVPTGTHRGTARIPRGAAIVGAPRLGAEEVEIYFEAGVNPPRGLSTLADRALAASARLLEGAAFGGCGIVAPEALVAVGIVDFARGNICLTRPRSARAVARWLETSQLGRAELRESGQRLDGREVMAVESPLVSRSSGTCWPP